MDVFMCRSKKDLAKQVRDLIKQNNSINKETGTLRRINEALSQDVERQARTIRGLSNLIKGRYSVSFFLTDSGGFEQYIVQVSRDSIISEQEIGDSGYINEEHLVDAISRAKKEVDEKRDRVLSEVIKKQLKESGE